MSSPLISTRSASVRRTIKHPSTLDGNSKSRLQAASGAFICEIYAYQLHHPARCHASVCAPQVGLGTKRWAMLRAALRRLGRALGPEPDSRESAR